MYGIAIVDPVNGYKKLMVEKTVVEANGAVSLDRQFYDADALEFQLQYNQLYLNDDGNYDATAMFAHQNTATVVMECNLVMYQTWLIIYSSKAM